MNLGLGIFFSVLALIGWGVHDMLIKKTVDEVGVLSSTLYRNSIIALILFFAALPFISSVPSLNTFLLLFIISVIGTTGFLCFGKALGQSKVSLISPLAHSAVIISVILAMIFLKESLSTLQVFAIISIILGTILVSFEDHKIFRLKFGRLVKGAPYALVTIVCWGFYYFLIKFPIEEIGVFLTGFYTELFLLIFMIIAAFIKKPVLPKKSSIPFFILFGVIGALGIICQNLGLAFGLVSISAPIVFASPLSAAIFARIFLKEKIEHHQKIAIFLIILGIVLVAI